MKTREKRLPLRSDPVPLPRSPSNVNSCRPQRPTQKPDLMYCRPSAATPIRGARPPFGGRTIGCLYTSTELMSTLTCLKDPLAGQVAHAEHRRGWQAAVRDSDARGTGDEAGFRAGPQCHRTMESALVSGSYPRPYPRPARAVWTALPLSVSAHALASPFSRPALWFSISSARCRRASRREV